jgi:hypothetical protein
MISLTFHVKRHVFFMGYLAVRAVTMGVPPIPCPHPAGRDLFGHLGPPCCFSEGRVLSSPIWGMLWGFRYGLGFPLHKVISENTHFQKDYRL